MGRIHAMGAVEGDPNCPPLSSPSGIKPAPLWSLAHGSPRPPGHPFPRLLGPLCWEPSPALPQLAVPLGRLALPSSFRWPWIPHVPETTHIPLFAKNGKGCLRHLAGWLTGCYMLFWCCPRLCAAEGPQPLCQGTAGSVPGHHWHPWPSQLTPLRQPGRVCSCGQTNPMPIPTIAPQAPPSGARWWRALGSQLQRKAVKWPLALVPLSARTLATNCSFP